MSRNRNVIAQLEFDFTPPKTIMQWFHRNIVTDSNDSGVFSWQDCHMTPLDYHIVTSVIYQSFYRRYDDYGDSVHRPDNYMERLRILGEYERSLNL